LKQGGKFLDAAKLLGQRRATSGVGLREWGLPAVALCPGRWWLEPAPVETRRKVP
jgi:hypothetical protein